MAFKPSLVLALALAALLAACGTQGAAQPTPVVLTPTEAPTAPPVETATPLPVAVPTAPPAGAAVLPRALYILLSGQIYRIEPDGSARTQISYEVPFRNDAVAVTSFAVSPADGSLAYTVQREGPPVLVRSGPDGENPVRLYDNATVGVSDPLFTPDGRFVAVRLTAPLDQQASFQSGLYLLPSDGSEPQLLVADDPNSGPAVSAFGQGPAAFSPDGTRLLTYRFGLSIELCDLGVVSVPDGTTIALQVPPAPELERVTTCGPAAWAPDGSAIYYTPTRIGASGGNTGIWRADPITGESFPLTPQPAGAPFTLYEFPGVMADGSLRAFVAQADELPEPFTDQPTQLDAAMARIDPANGMASELRAPVSATPTQVLWDGAGGGAVALLFPDDGAAALVWLPADGGEPVRLVDDSTDLTSYAWAP